MGVFGYALVSVAVYLLFWGAVVVAFVWSSRGRLTTGLAYAILGFLLSDRVGDQVYKLRAAMVAFQPITVTIRSEGDRTVTLPWRPPRGQIDSLEKMAVFLRGNSVDFPEKVAIKVVMSRSFFEMIQGKDTLEITVID